MTVVRFNFQRDCVLNTEGIVLNVGANEDPAGLKALAPDRVINCDIEEYDSYLDGRPNRVDKVFDAREPWPFEDDYAELVVLGDILEHLYPNEAEQVLDEANRVSQKVCITVPRDSRWREEGVQMSDTGYRTHCHEWTEEDIRHLLEDTGWVVEEWHTVDYFFVPEGYFILAERISLPQAVTGVGWANAQLLNGWENVSGNESRRA